MDRLTEKIKNIDYTHLLGYPSEVVAAEIMSMVKDVVSDHMDRIVEQLEDAPTLELPKGWERLLGGNGVILKKLAIEIIKKGGEV